jgi:hypothetical protein
MVLLMCLGPEKTSVLVSLNALRAGRIKPLLLDESGVLSADRKGERMNGPWVEA